MSHRPVLLLLAVLALAPAVPARADVAALVRPLAGTERGGTFPGATVPFGMVQYSPNTAAALGGGYRYSRPRTWGFATTHLSGPGCAALGDVVSLPRTGPVETVAARHQEATFTHASETASPGSYAVTLQPADVRAELTATARTGWARYTWPATRSADVVIDPGANFRGTHDATVTIRGDRVVEGSVTSWGFWGACPARGENRYRVYYSMRFSRPFRAYGTGNGAQLHRHERSARGNDAGAYVVFDAARDRRPVVAKVGISYVDLAGARGNLAAEGGRGFDFDGVRSRARAAWDALLGRVAVSGQSPAVTRTFYTALYHTLLHPSVFSDADGRYVGFDDRVQRTTAGRAHYTGFSMWDTYRSAHEVIDLVAPEVVADMMRSLLDDARQGGWLPKWPYAHFETNEMVGDPAANVLADAFLKGLLRRGDVGAAWAALLHNASAVPAPEDRFEGRTGLESYINRGYVPFHLTGDEASAASLNMEYAVNDCALALIAARLGRDGDRRYLLRRAKRYRYSVDASSRLARPRLGDGRWLTPFGPGSRAGFKEGAAAHYTWLAPQDVGGLAGILGGRPAARGELDAFFDYPRVAADPASAPAAWNGITRFTPRNEHDLQAPYLYDYLGEPQKTEEVVRAIEAMFTTEPNGLPSSDDLGTLSGWYVLSALGLYPLLGGDDHYALTTPLFDHVAIDAPRAFYPGGPIVIDAPGASRLPYVAAVTVGGRPLASSVLAHAALRRGAHVVFGLQAEPSATWATGDDTPVSACATNPRTADLRLTFLPASPGRLRMRIGNPGDAAARDATVGVSAPPGWSVVPARRTLGVLGPRRAVVLVWRVHTPRGAAPGGVRAQLTWEQFGDRAGALRTFATAMVP